MKEKWNKIPKLSNVRATTHEKIMRAIIENDGLINNEGIIKQCKMSMSYVSGLLQAYQKHGFVTIEKVGRSNYISMTDLGQMFYKAIKDYFIFFNTKNGVKVSKNGKQTNKTKGNRRN